MRTTGLFPYSGSKARVLKHLRPPPTPYVAEPFGGSLAYSLNSDATAIQVADTPELGAIYRAAQSDVSDWVERLEATPLVHGEDIRSARLPPWLEYLLRLTVCGVYVGQTTSFQVYGQYAHRAPEAVRVLGRFRQQACRITTICEDFRDLKQRDDPNMTWFVDPPYLGTFGNYRRQALISAEDIRTFVSGIVGPVCFTYGDDAREVFPEWDWELLQQRKVPKIRIGGVGLRHDFVTYLNWSK